MWPGMRPGDRVDRVADPHAALLELVGELLDRVLGLGDRHPVAGDEDDRVGVAELDRGVLGADRGDRALLPRRRAAALARRRSPANSRLPIERFIARLISSVRIVPEEPTRVPATIRATLSSANPAAAAAESPVNAFSSEITTGMSAPPIGSTNRLPSTAAAIRTAMKSPARAGVVVAAEHDAAGEDRGEQEPVEDVLAREAGSGGRGSAPGACRRRCSSPRRRPSRPRVENRIGTKMSSGMSPAERQPVAELRPGDQRRGAAADAVVEGDHLRHLGHLHPARGDHADRRSRSAIPISDQAPVADHVEGQRDRDRDRHARGGDQVAAARRASGASPAGCRR